MRTPADHYHSGSRVSDHYSRVESACRRQQVDPPIYAQEQARAKWQRGPCHRRRRGLPRKTDPVIVSAGRFTELMQLYNNPPRQCLDYRTPTEVFWHDVLPFKRESTFPSARE